MKILITGASGMVGRNLIETNPGHKLLIPNKRNLNLFNHDQIVSYLDKHNPDLIIHAAGNVGGIQANINDPTGFFIGNLQMGIKLLVTALNLGIEKVINIGSSCMYPATDETLREDMILTGKPEPTNEGYALAKISVMKFCQYINSQYGTSYKTVVPCNLFGKYDKFGIDAHLIPAIIAKLYNGDQTIWGDGTARRECLYAGDFARILWQYVKDFDQMPQVMNIGSGVDLSVNMYYHMVARVMGITPEFTHDLSKPVGTQRKLLDNSLQLKHGLQPKNKLNEALKKTHEYYLSIIK